MTDRSALRTNVATVSASFDCCMLCFVFVFFIQAAFGQICYRLTASLFFICLYIYIYIFYLIAFSPPFSFSFSSSRFYRGDGMCVRDEHVPGLRVPDRVSAEVGGYDNLVRLADLYDGRMLRPFLFHRFLFSHKGLRRLGVQAKQTPKQMGGDISRRWPYEGPWLWIMCSAGDTFFWGVHALLGNALFRAIRLKKCQKKKLGGSNFARMPIVGVILESMSDTPSCIQGTSERLICWMFEVFVQAVPVLGRQCC